jgi:hypothetical protein
VEARKPGPWTRPLTGENVMLRIPRMSMFAARSRAA